jgi:WD40 repeat protein
MAHPPPRFGLTTPNPAAIVPALQGDSPKHRPGGRAMVRGAVLMAAALAALPGPGRAQGVLAVAARPGGGFASGGLDQAVRLWSPHGDARGVLLGHPARVTALAFAPDGRALASADAWGSLFLWPLDATNHSPAPRRLRGHRQAVHGLAFTPDGKRLVSCGQDGYLRTWDADTGEPGPAVGPLPGPQSAVAVTADGRRLAVAGLDGAVRLFDAATGAPVRELCGTGEPVYALAAGPGHRLAVGAGDGSVRLWDAGTGRPEGTLAGRHEAVLALGFDALGRRLVGVGPSGMAVLWDPTAGVAVHVQHSTGTAGCVALSADGSTLAVGTAGPAPEFADVPENVR